MKIAIIGPFSYPYGYAETTRVHAYARGLSACGVVVKVICLKALEKGDGNYINTEARGVYKGIPFEYACGTTYRAKTFLRRRWLELQGAWGVWRMLYPRSQRPDAIILFSNMPSWITVIVMLSKVINAKCIQEKSEYPLVYLRKTWWRKPYSFVYIRTIYKMFDGIIAISTYLEEYFSRRVRKGARVLRVPIIVDTDEIKPVELSDHHGRHRIVYVGALGHPGEVSSLIQAFSMVAGRHLEWELQIIGDTPGTDVLAQMRKLARSLSLDGRVDFTGMVGRNVLPSYLEKASLLALLRSSGIFSKAGFPTKLGEYLATGKPVVVTSVGDIPLFLEDHVSAYLVPPDNTEAFAQKLDEAMSDYDHALDVGRKGREVAVREFDYRSNCRKIVEFVRELKGESIPNLGSR
jgi:glycosyltransferase involved in cell wall biosynthesis